MGFRNSIEEERTEQRLSAESAALKAAAIKDNTEAERKASEAMQQQELDRLRVRATEEKGILTKLFEELDEFGYIKYLQDVCGGLGFGQRAMLLTVCREYELGDVVDKVRAIGGGSGIYKDHMPTGDTYMEHVLSINAVKPTIIMDPHTQFFGDPVKEKRASFWKHLMGYQSPMQFTEPRDAGVEIRFSRFLRDEKPTSEDVGERHYNIEGGYSTSVCKVTNPSLYEAFYVRASAHNLVITWSGAQTKLNIADIATFDQALQRAATQPFSPAFTNSLWYFGTHWFR